MPLIAHDRVVGSLNVYRTGADVPFTRRRGRARRALRHDGRAGLRLRPPARHAARGGQHRQPHRPAQPPRQPGAPAGRARRAPAGGRSSVVSSSTSTTSSASTTPSATPRATARSRSPPRRCATSCASPTPSAASAARSSCSSCPAWTPTAAREAAERARTAISEVQIGGRQLACSAGLACHPDDASDAPGLLMAADAALYAAKDTGRGRTCRYRPSLALRPSPGEERERGRGDPARRRGAPSAVFQPVLELATGRVSGFEALARFHVEPPRGPDEWFAQAHRVGLGAELEAAALRAALAVPDRPAGTFLSLNVSPRALAQPLVQAELPARPLDDRDRADRARAVRRRGRAGRAARRSCARAARASRSTTPARATPACSS